MVRTTVKQTLASFIVGTLFLGWNIPLALSATLTGGSLTLSDSRISTASTSYTIQFSGVTTSAIKCIKIAFSDAPSGGSKPSGMDISSATLGGSSTYIPTPASWSVSNNNTTGVTSITYATGETPASASTRTVVLSGITNGSTAGTTYYAQFSTYNNTDCSSSAVDSGTVAFIYTNGQAVTATVDPTLSFSIGAVAGSQTVKSGVTTTIATTTSTIPLGSLSASANTIGSHDLTVGTNAAGGYTASVRYTGTLTSGGSSTIADHAGTNGTPTAFSSAGTSAFGYTTNDATLGTGTASRFGTNNVWAGFSTTNAEVAYSAAAASETTRIGYQTGISSTQAAGAYSTTVIYTATPTY